MEVVSVFKYVVFNAVRIGISPSVEEQGHPQDTTTFSSWVWWCFPFKWQQIAISLQIRHIHITIMVRFQYSPWKSIVNGGFRIPYIRSIFHESIRIHITYRSNWWSSPIFLIIAISPFYVACFLDAVLDCFAGESFGMVMCFSWLPFRNVWFDTVC